MTVTNLNVTRLSLDALYHRLDDLKESDDEYILIDAEIDRRLELENQALKARQQNQVNQMAKYHALQNEIMSIFESYKGRKTLLLIEKLGGDFIDDYTICQSTFLVESLVSHRSHDPNANSRWECSSMEEATSKKAKLIYYRIYDRFMRYATQENLDLLKKVLGC